jgi:hypothetical protein
MKGPRVAFLVLQLLSLPLAFASPLASAAVGASAMVAVIVWSYLSVANAARVRPGTGYSKAPKASHAILWWLFPWMVAVVGVAAVVFASRRVSDAGFAAQNSAEGIRLVVVVVAVILFVIAVYQPYGFLARAAAWTGGNPSKMRRWFWLPIAAQVAGAFALVIIGLSAGSDDGTGSASSESVALGVVGVVVMSMPWIVWTICGLRAMVELECAVRATATRSSESIEGIDVNVWASQYVIRRD